MPYEPTALKDLLNGMLPGQVASRLPPPDLLARWRDAAGEAIASRAHPVCLEQEGVLVVAVKGAVWKQELSLAGPALCQRLREAGFAVNRLKLVSATSPAPAPEPEAPLPPLSLEDEQEVAASLEGVSDPELRDALAGVLSALLRARKAPDR